MNSAPKRSLLYGAAALVLGGIGIAVATVSTEADAMTLLSTADVQLRLAYGIPEADKEGQALSSRQDMISGAIDSLEKAEAQMPGMAITAEFRGFAHMLRGEFGDAAACYARARERADCGDEQGDVLAFNEARMLRKAGDGEGALKVFADNSLALDSRFGHQRAIEEAEILRELGRTEEAAQRLEAVIADDSSEPMAWVQAACELDRLGHAERAMAVLERAVADVPIANYHLARLKLRQGEVDIAMECLERAAAAAPTDVMRLVRDEPEAWEAVAEDERFKRYGRPVAATPGR